MKARILRATGIRGVAVKPGDVVEMDEGTFRILANYGKVEQVVETPPAPAEPIAAPVMAATKKAAKKRTPRKRASKS